MPADKADKLKKLAQENQALAEALELQEALNQIIMHDMKNPLFAIQGSAQMMQMANASGTELDLQKLSERIERNSRGLLRMIRSLTALHCLEKGELALSPCPVDLKKLLTEIVHYFQNQPACPPKPTLLTFPENITLIFLDRALFESVLEIFFQYIYADAASEFKVHIQGEMTGSDKIKLKIYHNGLHIPAAFHQKIFQESCQLDIKTSGIKPARALGLVFCKKALIACGGDIVIEKRSKGGICFIISLPVCGDKAIAPTFRKQLVV